MRHATKAMGAEEGSVRLEDRSWIVQAVWICGARLGEPCGLEAYEDLRMVRLEGRDLVSPMHSGLRLEVANSYRLRPWRGAVGRQTGGRDGNERLRLEVTEPPRKCGWRSGYWCERHHTSAVRLGGASHRSTLRGLEARPRT